MQSLKSSGNWLAKNTMNSHFNFYKKPQKYGKSIIFIGFQ